MSIKFDLYQLVFVIGLFKSIERPTYKVSYKIIRNSEHFGVVALIYYTRRFFFAYLQFPAIKVATGILKLLYVISYLNLLVRMLRSVFQKMQSEFRKCLAAVNSGAK